ncbi:MAG: HD domain-containing protein [Thermodesulfovibrionia bacterium]|nr:HD domain-containing protein [Thermodesulfovibrionia bacterium]
MQRRTTVNLGNLALSLSDAMDLASPSFVQHQQRTAFVVWELGKVANFSDETLENNFIAALLHDVGALTLEERISIHTSKVENLELHCIRGEFLLAQSPLLNKASKIIRFHHKPWKNWDVTIDPAFALEAQMLSVADYLEHLIDRNKYILHQHENIISNIRSLSGSSFHPQVIDYFLTASEREEFWLDLVSPRLYSLLLNEGPLRKIEIGLSKIVVISELFRNIIDFRSHFTATHSSGVAAAASIISRIFGLTETEINLMEVAGNLHDLGKLAIPSSILEKPGKLTKEEMSIVKSHPYYTYSVINTIGGLQQMAEWAAYHHERLDGSGYPFHCKSDDLSTGARILSVADIFTALAEDRPYRKRMSPKEIVEIIKQSSDQQLLDKKICNLLFDNFDEISSYVIDKQAVAKDFYEQQFAFIDQNSDGF